MFEVKHELNIEFVGLSVTFLTEKLWKLLISFPVIEEGLLAPGLVTETKALKATKGIVELLSELLLLDFCYHCLNYYWKRRALK